MQGGTILNHRLTVFDKNHAQLANPLVRRAFTHAIDRQAIVDSLWAGRTRVPRGPAVGILRRHVPRRLDACRNSIRRLAQDLLKQANYKGDPIPYRLLNNYYTNQVATAQILVEMWKRSASTSRSRPRRTGRRSWSARRTRGVRDWSNSAPFNDPVSSLVAQHGPNGQQQQIGEWTNAELNKLSEFLETSTDRAARKKRSAACWRSASAKTPPIRCCTRTRPSPPSRNRIKWKAAPAFAMDFRAGNFEV